MNLAEQANKLRAERLEQERLQREQQDKENARVAMEQQKMKILGDKKTLELLPLFRQFDNHKIAEGHSTIRADTIKDGTSGADLVCLKIHSVGSSVVGRIRLGAVALAAKHLPEHDKYQLERHSHENRTCAAAVVGQFATADELMQAVVKEVSKL
jgi:hypothetical protein